MHFQLRHDGGVWVGGDGGLEGLMDSFVPGTTLHRGWHLVGDRCTIDR